MSHLSQMNPHMNWVSGYDVRAQGRLTSTYVAEYTLSHLMQKGLIDRVEGEAFLTESGLEDFHWEITWPEDFDMPDEMLVDRIANVEGYAVFIHGWTGNYHIWEDLPGLVVRTNRQLVAIAIDHNGFGDSVFQDKTPALDTCNPPAAMLTLQRWIDLIKIRRQPGTPRQKVINLIGHSMGGATLFYMNPILSDQYEATPRGITGATFMAMGRLKNYEIARDFSTMKVMLGHRDPLVGLINMMDLLQKMEFPAANIHVVPGTHYMFSVGYETPMNAYQHAQNREMVVDDILGLHKQAIQMQKMGVRYG